METKDQEKIKGSHIVCDLDPQTVYKKVNEFTKDKDWTAVHYSTTPVLVPGSTGQMVIYTSCLIFWDCTPDEWKSYVFQQKLSGGK